jgi:hypothetical protein
METSGTIEPGPKREVQLNRFTVPIENDVPVSWELNAEGTIDFSTAPGSPLVHIWTAFDPQNFTGVSGTNG